MELRLKQNEKFVENANVLHTETEDGYDGYYDDVLPIDAGDIKPEVDMELLKRIVILIAGVFIVICASVVVMYLL